MGKVRQGPWAKHFSVRLAQTEMDRIDRLIARYSTPWRTATRSDVMRLVLIQGLERVEQGGVLLFPVVQRSREGGSL